MDIDAKSLVQKIASDQGLSELLWKALLSDGNFVRAMVKALREAEADGA